MEKKKFELFKAPIMAIVVITNSKLMPGDRAHSYRFLFLIALAIPFFPIYKYASTLKNSSVLFVLFGYLIFYLISTVVITQKIRKIGAQWSTEEYQALKSDQITFPFILAILANASIHFLLLYLILQALIKIGYV